ncbi:hypothetical protein AVEN_158767-1 [Araneus ventricosus]|uniref:Uncharacterized protein n=1 Tax=Araneus ventricosus TaxID=182803 RepID=A0A4Y2MIT7_ARAVE|nr:hypothetical protein AVEN_158767-1 [Araneus ventricosus]
MLSRTYRSNLVGEDGQMRLPPLFIFPNHTCGRVFEPLWIWLAPSSRPPQKFSEIRHRTREPLISKPSVYHHATASSKKKKEHLNSKLSWLIL